MDVIAWHCQCPHIVDQTGTEFIQMPHTLCRKGEPNVATPPPTPASFERSVSQDPHGRSINAALTVQLWPW